MTDEAAAATETRYTFRRHALETGQTLSLETEGLRIEPEEGAATLLPWQDFREVRVQFAPTRVATRLFICSLTTASGRTVKIHSMTFEGFANFEDQGAAYSAFVRELHARLAAANPSVRYLTGSHPASFWSMLGCNVVIFGILAILLVVTAFALSPIALVKLVIVAIYLPLLCRWFRTNKPGTYDPADPPANMLPG